MSGGGVLIDNGTHSIDIARHLLGPVAEVLAVEGSRTQNPAVEDTVNLFLRSQSRVTATIDLSWTLNKESETFIRIYGTNGTILVGWRASKFRQTSSPDWIVFGKGYDKVAAFKHLVAAGSLPRLREEPVASPVTG